MMTRAQAQTQLTDLLEQNRVVSDKLERLNQRIVLLLDRIEALRKKYDL